MKIFILFMMSFILGCSPIVSQQKMPASFSYPRWMYIEKIDGWESGIFILDKTSEPFYVTAYPMENPPDMFSLHLFTSASLSKHNKTLIIITMFKTKIANFSLKSLVGEVAIDGITIPVTYDVSSDGDGIYKIGINDFEEEIISMMINGKKMVLALPIMMWKREVNLAGFSKAFSRTNILCAKGITR